MSNTRLWLLDEPSVNLDRAASQMVKQVIKDHCAKGGGVVFSSHIDLNLEQVEHLNLEQFRPKKQSQSDTFLAVLS